MIEGVAGKVAAWKEDRGFGFVRLDDGRSVFLSARVVAQCGLGDDGLPVGAIVRVKIEIERGGRERVEIIELVGDRPPSDYHPALPRHREARDRRPSARELAERLWIHPGADET